MCLDIKFNFTNRKMQKTYIYKTQFFFKFSNGLKVSLYFLELRVKHRFEKICLVNNSLLSLLIHIYKTHMTKLTTHVL